MGGVIIPIFFFMAKRKSNIKRFSFYYYLFAPVLKH